MDEYASLSHTKWECKYHVVPRGSLQNRPMRITSKPANEREARQAFLYPASSGSGKSVFLAWPWPAYTGITWTEDTAPQGCDRSTVQQPEWRGRREPPRSAAILA